MNLYFLHHVSFFLPQCRDCECMSKPGISSSCPITRYFQLGSAHDEIADVNVLDALANRTQIVLFQKDGMRPEVVKNFELAWWRAQKRQRSSERASTEASA